MNSHARVVVIGGGVTSCSVLYHLARMGWSDCILVERQELTSGSSWHAAGSLFGLTSPSAAAGLQRYTRELYPVIEAESGQSCGHHRCGGISLARSAEEAKKLKILKSRCLRNGIDSEFLSLEEARRRVPVVATDGVLAVLWESEKGYVDPAGVTQAFAKAARNRGAAIVRQAPVTATRQLEGGEWEVATPQGTIRCQVLVNAAGLWAREVAALAGIALPLVPVEHHYLVTERIPEVAEREGDLPNISDAEGSWYCRQEGEGLLLGAYEKECRHWAEARTPLDFGHELLPDDLARMDENFAHAVACIPCLGAAGIKRVINGPMIFSPDLAPLLGPVPGKRNYFCACGVMTGFNQAGGVGHVIAEWIIEGEPSLDIFCWDLTRFGAWAGKAYTKARTKYFYENRMGRIYPYQQLAAGRPVGTFPIHDRLAAEGAVFGESFGCEVPLWYARFGEEPVERYAYERGNWFERVGEEARAVRRAAGLFEISSYAKYQVRGPGAGPWLERMLASRMPQSDGRTALAPMLSPRGRLIGDFTATRLAEDRFLVLGAGAMQRWHLRWFEQHLPRDGSVRLENLSKRWCGLHLAGPDARAILAGATAAEVGGNAFPFLAARVMEIGGVPEAVVIRVSFTGELGYEIYVPAEHQRSLFDALREAGRGHGLRPAGMRTLMALRLEKSFPTWGSDLSADYTPWATPLGRFVRLDKGAFIGRDAAARSRDQGGHERFATFVVDADGADAAGGEAIFKDGRFAGYVTSGGYGYAVGESLALGYLKPQFYEPDGAYEVEIIGERRKAHLSERPRYDPQGGRMRS